jgi:hypothetical protein
MTFGKFPTGKVCEKLSRHFNLKKNNRTNASDALQNLHSMLWVSPASLSEHIILGISEAHTQNLDCVYTVSENKIILFV